MKKTIAMVLMLVLVGIAAYAEEQPALEIWANFNDNQKALYTVLDEIDEEIEMVFEYLGNMDMADGSRETLDLLFIVAPEAENGMYVLDLKDGEFYDHINDNKVGEFKDREHAVNTLMNSWASGNTEFLWYDMEVKLYMSAEEIQTVLNAAA